jgi:hypothetical protein
MTSRLFIVALVSLLTVSGCTRVSDSRLNPFNWFGGETTEDTVAPAPVEPTDPRPRVQQITALVIERTPTGAIVRATGVPATQGWHGAALVPASETPRNGEMVYVFRAFPPDTRQPVSTVRSREITAARSLSVQELANIRSVRVEAAVNARTARR